MLWGMDKRFFFLKILVAGMAGTVGAVVMVPAVITVLSPALERKKGADWRPVGPMDDFPEDSITKATVRISRPDWASSLQEKGVFVSRVAGGDVIVFSMSCTDLSCPVSWDAGSGFFFCPCHGGIFGRDGRRMAGPPKKPLYRYATRVRNGVIEIDLNSVPPTA